MPNENKPREWKLFYKTTGYSGRIHCEELGSLIELKDYPREYRVVEMSALTAALARIAELEENERQLHWVMKIEIPSFQADLRAARQEIESEKAMRKLESANFNRILPEIHERLKTYSANSHMGSRSEDVLIKFEKFLKSRDCRHRGLDTLAGGFNCSGDFYAPCRDCGERVLCQKGSGIEKMMMDAKIEKKK